MVTLDRIRLTGLLRKTPAQVGVFYARRRTADRMRSADVDEQGVAEGTGVDSDERADRGRDPDCVRREDDRIGDADHTRAARCAAVAEAEAQQRGAGTARGPQRPERVAVGG